MAEPGSDFDIHPVTRAEAAAWRELRLEALKNHPTVFMSSYEEAVKRDLAFFAERIPQPGGADVLFGVYVADELCGCAGFGREPGEKEKHKGFMWGVYLRPNLRGRGVGEALVGRLPRSGLVAALLGDHRKHRSLRTLPPHGLHRLWNRAAFAALRGPRL